MEPKTEKAEVLQPMYRGPETEGKATLQVFVMMTDYYSNPYAVLVVAENEKAANLLIAQAQADGFRKPNVNNLGYYGYSYADKLLAIDPTVPGIYVFSPPGNRHYDR
jgi:hypothetical protein